MIWFIVSPPYRHNSAGIVVLHRLCHKLNELGEEAFMSTSVCNPEWNTPFKAFPNSEDITVYPEIISGNPFNSKRVVRYVLYYPGAIGGDKSYDSSEIVVYYDEVYRIGPGPIVTISALNTDELYNTHEKKVGSIVFVHKGDKLSAPYPKDAMEITLEWPTSRKETTTLLRNAKRLYCYDLHSSMIHEALACGAEAYIPKNGEWVKYEETKKPPSWNDLTATKRLIELVRNYV